MATVDELVIKVFFDEVQLKSSANKNKKVIDDFANDVKNSLTKAVGSLAGAFGLDFAKGLADRFITAGSKLNVLSNNLQTSAKDLYTWQQVMIRAGGTAEDYTSAITTLYTKLNDAQLTKNPELLNILQNVLGVTPFENGKRKDIIKLTQDVINSLYKLPLNVAQPLADRMGLGSLSKLMAQFKSPEELQNAIQHVQQLGVVTDDQALKLQNAKNQWNDFNQQLDNVGNNLIVSILPELSKLNEWAKQFFTYLKTHQKEVEGFFISIIGLSATLALVNPFSKWLVAITALIAAVSKLYGILDDVTDHFKESPFDFGIAPQSKFGFNDRSKQTGKRWWEELKSFYNSQTAGRSLDYQKTIEELAPAIRQIESSGGKKTNTGNGAYGDYQIRPNWGNRARAREGLEPQSPQWYLDPKNNYDTYKLMMLQNLKEHHGDINAAIREYSGNNYGYEAVQALTRKGIPTSANIQSTGIKPSNASSSATNNYHIQSLNVHGTKDPQHLASQLSQSTKVGYAFSSGILA